MIHPPSVAVFVFYGQHITLLGEFKIPGLVVRNVMNHAPTLAHGTNVGKTDFDISLKMLA